MNTDLHAELLRVAGPTERYCITSGRPVKREGDRCIKHGAASTMCQTDVRPAQCRHLLRSPNHPEPRCSECGKPIPMSVTEQLPGG